ncbi:MAG: 30S ribosomal protein S6 [Proteobacteria bacterium]|nr:30S ribosomal protein S6 [Pseudomonadota bacterium]MBU1059330.1 30S ribosomal protein S6 [Pseudomonadota bacterium]
MRRYETIYILRPTLSEDEINTIIKNTNTIICTGNGQIISLDKWGLRKLAYLIKKESQGFYIYCDFATDTANVAEMERKFRIDDAVMKYMTVKLADAITEEEIETARGEHEIAKAKAAEAAASDETSDDTNEETDSETVDADEND